MDANPYKADFNLKAGTIEIRDNVKDGSVRFSCMLDEALPIVEQMRAAIRKAEFIMSSPLMADKITTEWQHHAMLLLAETHAAFKSFVRGDSTALSQCFQIIEVLIEKHHLPEKCPHRNTESIPLTAEGHPFKCKDCGVTFKHSESGLTRDPINQSGLATKNPG
jgi:hypothetical protein